MKILIAISLVVLLSGCEIITPTPRGATLHVEPEFVYPQVASAYIWDESMGIFYFIYKERRRYMPIGWHYKNGYLQGNYKYKR